ncbi:MAG: hypothetical protein AVDCRST_MAG40-1537, partial [uncultured Gemmatimonadaceae bacterium]
WPELELRLRFLAAGGTVVRTG